MQGRGRGNVAAERLCGALFVGLPTLKGYFYINLGGTLYWTLHASEPGAGASALIWLTLVAIGLIWQLYGLFAAVPFVLQSIRILRNEYLIRTRKPN